MPLVDSPEPPVPPLPPSARASAADVDGPVGMATTIDQPVQVSSRVNRSRGSSISASHGPGTTPLTSPAELEAGRTSWGGHPPPPAHTRSLVSQRSNDWAPVDEHGEDDEGAPSISEMSTDVDENESVAGANDADEEDGDHTFNSGLSHHMLGPPQHHLQNEDDLHPDSYHRSSTAMGKAPMRPESEREVYGNSLGNSSVDEWGAPVGGARRDREATVRYMQGVPLSRATDDTDVSEISESEFDEDSSQKHSEFRRRLGSEERTAAVILAEEGGGLIVNIAGGTVRGLDIKPGS